MDQRPILLVEDNPDDEALAIRAFRRSKVVNRIIVARDGAEALTILFGGQDRDADRKHELPALVLLDLKLPKVDGLEVLRRMRADDSTRYLPVVVMTSSSQEEDRLASYEGGANSYVRKPVDFQRFVQSVESLGIYWLVINEPYPGRGRDAGAA